MKILYLAIFFNFYISKVFLLGCSSEQYKENNFFLQAKIEYFVLQLQKRNISTTANFSLLQGPRLWHSHNFEIFSLLCIPVRNIS